MAFKMKGYSAFTKKEEKEYEPQSKTFVGDMNLVKDPNSDRLDFYKD